MRYRVCIPCAGTGSRLGDLTKFLNKSLVSIANRPALSHLIEQFPDDAEFVIALGHKGQLVRDFIELAYPKRKFFFSEVQTFEGPGSGLGLSLLSCKDYLQQPFIFTSCDTLVAEEIPFPEENWLGFADVNDISQYRTVAVDEDKIVTICEKTEPCAESRHAYIGLAGIADYSEFWDAMEYGGAKAIDTGEVFGVKALLELKRDVKAKPFTWYDTGNPQVLAKVREAYQEPETPNILEKNNEAIWFVGDQVIKFSDDKKFIANRVKRVNQLAGFVPEVTDSRPNMYRYGKVDASVLSDVVTIPLFNKLLENCRKFWLPAQLDKQEQLIFTDSCRKFYRDKTFERVDLFYKTFDKTDGTEPINGVDMPTLQFLLEGIDWDWLSAGTPGRFHGDFHFENILWNESMERFTFLDWRQDFGGDLEVGDIYYDLAKLLHGLIVNHGLITQDRYSVNWTSSTINFDLNRRQILVECERQLDIWLDKMNLDKKKVRILTAIIYLNIAALHHYPYSLLLYALGKTMLAESFSR
jgi:NDP-sugar pyrophosphorylase family protein